MKINLSTDFSVDEKNLISPYWNDGVWGPTCDIEIYSEVETDSLDDRIVGIPKRHIFVDIMNLIETDNNGKIKWYMCCPKSIDDKTLVSCGEYDTFKDILRAL